MEGIFATITWKEDMNFFAEVLSTIKRLNLDPVETVSVLEMEGLLRSHTETLQPGRPIKIPSVVFWEWIRERQAQNAKTVFSENATDPNKLAEMRDLLEHPVATRRFLEDPRNKFLADSLYVVILALVILAYALIPPVILYFGGYSVARVARWIADGFVRKNIP